ncbi:hypothetical protein DINM_004825 [Dirofilaria immitis]|nr:hypothetical protein [Dirofilaria immitis]
MTYVYMFMRARMHPNICCVFTYVRVCLRMSVYAYVCLLKSMNVCAQLRTSVHITGTYVFSRAGSLHVRVCVYVYVTYQTPLEPSTTTLLHTPTFTVFPSAVTHTHTHIHGHTYTLSVHCCDRLWKDEPSWYH